MSQIDLPRRHHLDAITSERWTASDQNRWTPSVRYARTASLESAMIASGVSLRRSVSPGWPFCPPGFLPDGSRKLLTRGGFLSPSLDGGLPLLLLFSPRRRSNSAICARNAAISAACPACCASSSAMRSSFESWSRAVRSTDSFESTRRSHVNRILHPCPASRHNTRTPACDRVSWTVGLGTWAVTESTT